MSTGNRRLSLVSSMCSILEPVGFQKLARVRELRFSSCGFVLADQAAEDRLTPDPFVDRIGDR